MMNNAFANKPPTWFWVVASLALLWQMFGVASYLMQVYGGGPALQARMTEAQRALDAATPAWVIGAYAIAVFAGLIGAIGLLVRRSWAKLFLIVSLVALLAQFGWVLLISEALALLGASAALLPCVIAAVAVALILFARNAEKRGWLS